jgi:hypothetical protein
VDTGLCVDHRRQLRQILSVITRTKPKATTLFTFLAKKVNNVVDELFELPFMRTIQFNPRLLEA